MKASVDAGQAKSRQRRARVFWRYGQGPQPGRGPSVEAYPDPKAAEDCRSPKPRGTPRRPGDPDAFVRVAGLSTAG